jgi:hypothetical protein
VSTHLAGGHVLVVLFCASVPGRLAEAVGVLVSRLAAEHIPHQVCRPDHVRRSAQLGSMRAYRPHPTKHWQIMTGPIWQTCHVQLHDATAGQWDVVPAFAPGTPLVTIHALPTILYAAPPPSTAPATRCRAPRRVFAHTALPLCKSLQRLVLLRFIRSVSTANYVLCLGDADPVPRRKPRRNHTAGAL